MISSLNRIVTPVASEDDAKSTAAAIARAASDDVEVIAVYVIEKAGGAPDKASVEQREERAGEMFDIVRERLEGTNASVSTRIAYDSDVASAILDVAREEDADAVVVVPRGGSRWRQLLTGDVARRLLNRADRPIVVLPRADR